MENPGAYASYVQTSGAPLLYGIIAIFSFGIGAVGTLGLIGRVKGRRLVVVSVATVVGVLGLGGSAFAMYNSSVEYHAADDAKRAQYVTEVRTWLAETQNITADDHTVDRMLESSSRVVTQDGQDVTVVLVTDRVANSLEVSRLPSN